MENGATFDTSSFNRFLGDLQIIGGPSVKSDAVVRGEIASLVKVCIEYTPQAKPGKIRQRAEYRFNEKYAVRGEGDLKLTYNTTDPGSNANEVTQRAGDGNNVWMRSGGKWHIMVGPGRWSGQAVEGGSSRIAPGGAHWPDWLWAQYQMLKEDDPKRSRALKKDWIAKALASRGLARLSWLQAADSLGIEIPGVDVKLRQAKGSDGRAYLNGRSQNLSNPEALLYELTNVMPALVAGGLDGPGIASRAMATREKAFEIALEKNLFDDIAQVAARYPSLLAA